MRSDQIVWLANRSSIQHYPDKFAPRSLRGPQILTRAWYFLTTDNFELPALTIAQLYKNRWKVELFFKWM